MPEWTKYRLNMAHVGDKQRGPDELTFVNHVAHVPTARKYLADGKIESGLVYDESRLRGSSTRVTWLSANTWGPGSLYGNVQFTFNWRDIIGGRQVYWVEDMDYPNPAYRFLVTKKDMRRSNSVQVYDPERDEGPIRKHNGLWYWRDDYTSEFMLESDISLNDCVDFRFINHRPDKCRLHGLSCPDRNASPFLTGGRVLATVLAKEIHSIDHILSIRMAPQRPLSEVVGEGIAGIRHAFRLEANFKSSNERPRSRRALVRDVLELYGADLPDRALRLAGELRSWDDFKAGLAGLVNDHFGIDDFEVID